VLSGGGGATTTWPSVRDTRYVLNVAISFPKCDFRAEKSSRIKVEKNLVKSGKYVEWRKNY
jgi:hypothetical protein